MPTRVTMGKQKAAAERMKAMWIRRERIRRLTGLVVASCLLLGMLSGCRFTEIAIARAHSRERFVPTQSNPDVRYVPGSQIMADRVAKALAHSREVVEQTHGAAFKHAPRVFVCNTDCFLTFVGPVSREAPATQSGDAVFMNDDVLRIREEQRGMPMEGFLTHELAHLLLYQRAGMLGYLRVPEWFKEGIAVVVSNGVGIQSCTPTEAAQVILAGNTFDPGEGGSLFRSKGPSSYGLSASVFYREAALFVEFLIEQNPMAFRSALTDVLDGRDFQASFTRAYDRSIASFWPKFVASVTPLARKP